MATSSPSLTNNGLSAVVTPPKTLRGLNKPKCIQCGNVARSRCPFQSCKGCCSRAENPCPIHVLKAAATSGEKTQAPSTPSSDQKASEGTPGYRGGQHYSKPRYNNNNNTQAQSWQQPATNQKGPRPYLGRCQFCNVHGHSARRCPQIQNRVQGSTPQQADPFTPWQPRANLAMGSPYNADQWLLDSGATHHITSDLQNLSLHQPYSGGNDVTTADGSSNPITHTGSLSLPTNTGSLALQKVLYVPNIQKNLISVYRLCNANRVSVEFFPASFQVKDLSTGSNYSAAKLKTSYTSGQ